MSITVDFDKDNFTVNNKAITNVNELFQKFKNNYSSVLDLSKYDIEDFQGLNTAINRGDCIKDKTPGATLDQLGLFAGYYAFNDEKVKDMAHKVVEVCKQNGTIIRNTFTKDKKGDNTVKEHYPGLYFDVGFDAGLGLDNFLQTTQYKVFESFGKYIDPSTTRDASSVFPSSELSIAGNALQKIGYENCIIDFAKYIKHDMYDYNIYLSNFNIRNKNKDRKQDPNISTIFVGNKAKKSIIQNSNTNINQKRAMVYGKSMGDKLQVFLMFIKHQYEKSSRITVISTCDEIVLLFCILLQLPCFYNDKTEEKGIKLKETIYYNVDNTNPTKSKQRFDTEKKIVLKKYDDMIKLLRELNTNTPIYISGDDTKTYTFKQAFYDGMINDLTELRNISNKINVNSVDDISSINKEIDKIKKMTVNQFLRKGNGKYTLIRSSAKYNQYTAYPVNSAAFKTGLADKLNIDRRKIQNATFYFIATTYASNSGLIGGSQIKGSQIKGSQIITKGSKSKTVEFDDLFDTEPAIVHLKSDEDDLDQFDANEAFRNEVFEIYAKMNPARVPFFDVYSELLCHLCYSPDYSTEYLQKTISDIINDLNQNLENDNMLIKEMIITLKKKTNMIPTKNTKKLLTRRQRLKQSNKLTNVTKRMKSKRTTQIHKTRINTSTSERMIV
jgi:hypothetical protein